MVAPFLGPLRRWIKKNKPKQKRQNEISNAQERSETPTGATTPIMKQEILSASQAKVPSMDESSQALKLLLGIVPASAEESSKAIDMTSIPTSGKNDDALQIDLASLFLKPASKPEPVNIENHHSESTVPLSLLNTSIETSILDQIRPGPHQLPSSWDPRYPVNPQPIPEYMTHQDRSRMHNTPLPPWMQPQFFGSPSTRPESLHSHMMPAPPPNFHELRGHPQNNMEFSRMPSGPPGLAGSNTGSLQFPPTSRIINPNAKSLLSILKPLPKDNSPIAQDMSRHQSVTDNSRPIPMEPAKASVEHKQSLLALLKPQAQMHNSNPHLSQQGTQNMAHTQNSTAPLPPRTDPATNSRDAFLLDYLMQASGGP